MTLFLLDALSFNLPHDDLRLMVLSSSSTAGVDGNGLLDAAGTEYCAAVDLKVVDVLSVIVISLSSILSTSSIISMLPWRTSRRLLLS